ncbi:hypothetical protein FQA39_LY02928 [Lamprigera yunnana]|nr:hypothetical protein FQA39_LY02928 [Lamprigera yunnana]
MEFSLDIEEDKLLRWLGQVDLKKSTRLRGDQFCFQKRHITMLCSSFKFIVFVFFQYGQENDLEQYWKNFTGLSDDDTDLSNADSDEDHSMLETDDEVDVEDVGRSGSRSGDRESLLSCHWNEERHP